MSEPTYTITITETERTAFAKVLGGLVTKLINAPIQINGQTSSPVPSTTPPAIAAPPSPIATRDRWARDRQGNEVPSPDGAEKRRITIWKTKQAEKFLKVTWQSAERGYVDANCFDKELWPWLIKQSGHPTDVYLVKKDKYLNIVGVHA